MEMHRVSKVKTIVGQHMVTMVQGPCLWRILDSCEVWIRIPCMCARWCWRSRWLYSVLYWKLMLCHYRAFLHNGLLVVPHKVYGVGTHPLPRSSSMVECSLWYYSPPCYWHLRFISGIGFWQDYMLRPLVLSSCLIKSTLPLGPFYLCRTSWPLCGTSTQDSLTAGAYSPKLHVVIMT